MKHCTECDWYRVIRGDIGTFEMCHNPATRMPTGSYQSTHWARVHPCGADGTFWEPIKPYIQPTWWQRLWGRYDNRGRKL